MQNHDIGPSISSVEQDASQQEKWKVLVKKSLAAVAIGLAAFGVGKGLEQGSHVQEEAALSTIGQVQSEVPEAGEGTFLGDTLQDISRAKSGGLSGNIEHAMSINESHNVLTPVQVDVGEAPVDAPVSPEGIIPLGLTEDSPAASLADSEGHIAYTEDATYDLNMAKMHAKVGESLDTAATTSYAIGAAGALVGTGLAGTAAMAATRGKKRQE